MSNIFDKLAAREHANDTKLGLPSTDRPHFHRRKHLMSVLAAGKGWRIPAKEPARRADGTTRGERKRARAERAFAHLRVAA
ncbi:hypothetical protein [Endobacterium cereale]|uniref:hypothetical protein n=1 Tax=Endobacterium cereale TaxID=2663029 RepID=UPI002B48907C|nr:hypothetical protein [Endobacterium cereale]MEB2845891.1 hypothetical protein [Endobacterium cereale]